MIFLINSINSQIKDFYKDIKSQIKFRKIKMMI